LEFQRLREIKQLGAVYYVFPGAIHTRFEHSLGVGYMAQTMMEHFLQTQKDELAIEDRDKDVIVMAGLCNDLGQGIFSHLFDRQVIPMLAGPSLKWDYKDASIMMLRHLVDQNSLDFFDTSELKKVCEIIKGSGEIIPDKKAWLFDIVSNKRNAIDADKFDYIQRDIHSLGLLRNTFDPFRLIYSCKVVNNRVCYHQKNNDYLSTLFQLRYNLFK
jgi:deoxynucleoside triphosphate triphosphohydrolase SAMHD1